MFKKIKKWAENITAEESPVKPKRFNDPLASETGWEPVKPGGTNFKTHKLVETDHHRLEFRSTTGAKLFSGVFAAFGIGAVLLSVFSGFEVESYETAGSGFWATYAGYLFGLLFLGVGIGLYYFMSIPRVFDKWTGFYWKGYKEPERIFDPAAQKNSTRLSDIHAIQIISEWISGDKSSYHSYELNLVLKNGERINVVDHGKLDRVRKDADTLARFLNVPVWDAA